MYREIHTEGIGRGGIPPAQLLRSAHGSRSEREETVMTRGMHLVRTMGIVVVALGLTAQAAQASPFGLEPGGAARANAPAHHAGVPLGLLARQIKTRWQPATTRPTAQS